MSARTTASATLVRRRSRVFVDIPHSPFHTQRHTPVSSPHALTDLKENAPVHLLGINSQGNMTSVISASKKRKIMNDEKLESHSQGTANPKTKKPKISASAPQPGAQAKASKPKDAKEIAEGQHAESVEEFPNGFFYCHQCCRKRDMSNGVHCTYKRENVKSKGQLERCKLKYCGACLKNRYQEDMDAVKSTNVSDLSTKQREQHVSTESFVYKCPRCRDECNCRFCRKAKGLEPTGNLNLIARKAEKAAAAEKAKNKSPSSASTKAKSGKPAQPRKNTKANGAAGPSETTKARVRPKTKVPPAKPVPKPTWTRIATDLTFEEAETRIHIREFVVRFASILQIAHSHLEELEEISGDNLGETLSWDDNRTGGVELISWVSELRAKVIIQGLLDLIAGSADARGAHEESKVLREAAKNVKNSGANLNRVWTALLWLQEALPRNTSLTFSDPLSPPASTIIRTTRQTKDLEIVHVANSAQLIPVIVDLIEAAIPSPAIRDALEVGASEEKDYGKLAREAIAAENNRWKEAKDGKDAKKNETKVIREQHQHVVEDMEYAHRLAASRCISRTGPLGRDSEGRVYYAMTPGFGESEASIHLLKGKDGRVKVGRKKGGFTEEDRKEMERWSWFIAVWGRKPVGAEVAKRDVSSDEEDDEDDSDDECWWGFWHPQEVSKIAEWLAFKSGLGEGAVGQRSEPSTKKTNSSAKTNGTRSRTSTGSSSLTSLSSSHSSSKLSEMSDISESSEDEGEGTRVNFERPGPSKREMRGLVNGLKEFADLLQWRIKRAASETSEKLGKEAAKPQAVPANRFYA